MGKYTSEILEQQKNKEVLVEALKEIGSDSSRLSRQSQLQMHQEVTQEVDCLQCANCCKTLPALLNDDDLDRISAYLKLSRAAFVKKHVAFDEDGDMVLNKTPCVFLNTDNTCAIYEVRPQSCAEYPHTDDPQFHQYVQEASANLDTCPIVGRMLKKIAGAKIR